jgi:hypothetical protein
MAQREFPVEHSVVVDTVTRTVRHRAVIIAGLEEAAPGQVWPEADRFEGFGVTLEDAIRAAFAAYRASRG